MDDNHVKPEMLGMILYNIIASTEDEVAKRYKTELGQINVPESGFATEIMAVRWIAMDLAIAVTFGNGLEQNAILDPFLDCLHQNSAPELESFLTQRVRHYTTALDDANARTLVTIGAALAQFLFEHEVRSEEDVRIVRRMGMLEFASVFEGLRRTFDRMIIDW